MGKGKKIVGSVPESTRRDITFPAGRRTMNGDDPRPTTGKAVDIGKNESLGNWFSCVHQRTKSCCGGCFESRATIPWRRMRMLLGVRCFIFDSRFSSVVGGTERILIPKRRKDKDCEWLNSPGLTFPEAFRAFVRFFKFTCRRKGRAVGPANPPERVCRSCSAQPPAPCPSPPFC